MANQGKINLYKLKYRVVFCSGEDTEYPVTELLDNSPQSRGWQSPKFCEYPQEIILQFTNVVKLKQIQFLSHQSKISQKVELYTFVPSGNQALSTQIPLNQIKFTKLGYLSLDSNERSQFQARELKSVYVDSITLLLKLVFHKCYVNKFNLYNQVGLIALNCMGEMHSSVSGSSPPQQMAQQRQSIGMYSSVGGVQPNIEEELNMDKSTMETLKALYSAKERAIQYEDFDEAKRIKDTIDRLKSISTHISALEEKKKIAIQRDDFDQAKMVKIEIENLKQSVMYPHFQQPQFNPNLYGQQASSMLGIPGQFGLSQGMDQMQFNAQFQHSPNHQAQSNIEGSPQRFDFDKFEERKGTDQFVGGEFGRNQENLDVDRQFEEEEAKQKIQQEVKLRSSPVVEQQEMKKPLISYDEQVIPTMIKQPNKKGEGIEGDDNGQDGEEGKVEELSPENMKYAEPLIPIFGEDVVKKMFSRPWAIREEGLKECEEIIKKNGGDQAVFQAALSASGQAMGDKVAQIIQRGMSMLQTALKAAESQMEPGNSSTLAFNQLFNRLGDNNARIREKAEEILLLMASHKSFGAQIVCQYIIKGQVKKSAQYSVKHILGRLQLLNKVLQKFPVAKHNINYQACLEYGLFGFKHQNGDIRTQSYNVILEIYKSVGSKIKSNLSGLRPSQMEMLENGFCEIDGVDPAEAKAKQGGGSPPKDSAITQKGALGSAGGSGKPGTQSKKTRTKGDEKCQFCNKNDKGFANNETLDLHFWKDCVMLTECKYCSQVIEIETYNQHLLKECEKSSEFQQCQRCKESIHSSTFEQHTADKSCQVSKPAKSANRCPLCHQDIKAGESGWKKHLQDEGCPSNPRKKL